MRDDATRTRRDMASRSQRLARRAYKDVAHLVVDEVLMQECAVLTVRFVADRTCGAILDR